MKHGRADETLEWLGLGSLQDSYDKAVAGAEADTIRGARKAGLRQGLWSIFSLPRPRWPIFLITRNERPYKGWWGSRTSTTSGNESCRLTIGDIPQSPRCLGSTGEILKKLCVQRELDSILQLNLPENLIYCLHEFEDG